MSADRVMVRVALCALLQASAVPATATEDLAAIYLRARERDPQLSMARSQVAVAEEKQVQARAALLPHPHILLRHQRVEVGLAGTQHQFRLGLPQRQRRLANLERSLLMAKPKTGTPQRLAHLQGSDRAACRAVRIGGAVERSLPTLPVHPEVGRYLAEGQVQAVTQQLALARENFQAGLTTVADVHEAQARLALARAQVASARVEESARQAELHRLLGAAPPPLARLGRERSVQAPALEPAAVEPWLSAAEGDNPQLLAQQLAVAIASQEVRKQSQAHGPSLDFTLGYGRNSATGSMTSPTELASRSHATQLGVQLNIPLYAGGATQSRVREALALHEKVQAELESTRRQLQAQLRQAHAAVVMGQMQVESLTAAVSASHAAVDANRIGYRLGTRINIDVLNAQQQQFSAERDLHKARADLLLNTLRLKAAAGQLREADLQAMAPFFGDQ